MDSLEDLDLGGVGIEVLPSSVGRYCTNLISIKLVHCSKLKTIEGNFHALKRLEKFELYGETQLEKFPKDLFDVKCCLGELCFELCGYLYMYPRFDSLPLSPPHLPRLLRKLNLSGLRLKDGEVPCEIGELFNLQDLHLCDNDFSRLAFSISQLTRLKLLNLSECKNLVELPELPSNLSILQADNCESLEAIRDDVHRNCNWLCQVSIKSYWRWSLVGGERLLESMLQGMAIEHHQCMRLHLKGIDSIPRGFEPRLVRGNKCRLKLPENWFNEYTGFLFCSVLKGRYLDPIDSVIIRMRNGGMGGDSQDEKQVFWEEKEESVDDDFHTWVGYVSFGSLRCTAWWDQTSPSVDFSIELPFVYTSSESLSGFGARLVSKNNQMEETATTNFPSDDDDYKMESFISGFKIHSKSLLECQFEER